MEYCPFCGARPGASARFCPECGRELVSVKPEQMDAVDLSALDRLRREKKRLSLEMAALHEASIERDLTESERRSWTAIRNAWQEVTSELTERLDPIAPRSGPRRMREQRLGDRRTGPEPVEPTERRSGAMRRMGERRLGEDRRDPFPTDAP
jgi:rRNA maturation protein Nop10